MGWQPAMNKGQLGTRNFAVRKTALGLEQPESVTVPDCKSCTSVYGNQETKNCNIFFFNLLLNSISPYL